MTKRSAQHTAELRDRLITTAEAECRPRICPEESTHPAWHPDAPTLRPGVKVLLAFRTSYGVTWVWCRVGACIDGRVRVQLPGCPADSGLTRGETVDIVPAEHVHLVLEDAAAEEALAAWHRERCTGPILNPAADAASAGDSQ